MEPLVAFSVTKQEGLGTAPDGAKDRPHHIRRADGSTAGFRNPHASFVDGAGLAGSLTVAGFFRLMGVFLRYRMSGRLKAPDTTPPTVTVRKPTFLPTRAASSTGGLRTTWLGHACYYIEFPSGLRVLFDPVFEDRCSPLDHVGIGPKRFTPAPCVLADLPAVDAVVISHSHYDHLSGPSVRTLRQHHPRAHFFVGLGLADWFRRAGIDAVTELDWWQEAEATVRVGGDKAGGSDTGRTLSARFSCLPSQHTSARTLFDRDRTLWCSWAVASAGRSVYFGGDTGYRSVDVDHTPLQADGRETAAALAADTAARASRIGCPDFASIGRLRGPFDVGLLAIGAYTPRSLFSGMHADPMDAVDIFRDTCCRRALGMHWGTWALTTEPVMEPPSRLRAALQQRGLAEGVFDVCEIGESREF